MNTPAGGVTLPELPDDVADRIGEWYVANADRLHKLERDDSFGLEDALYAGAKLALAGEWRVPKGWHDDFSAWWESPDTERRFHCGHFSDKDMAAAAIGWYIARQAAAPLPKEPGHG